MGTMKRARKVFFLSVIVLVISAFMVGGVFAAEAKKGTPKQVDIEALSEIKNPNAEFKVELRVDKEDANYKVGDEVKFFFKTDRDCRLTLLNVATSGQVMILFPNEYQKDNKVTAGSEYKIPAEGAKFVFRAKGPAGKDVIKAIATLEPIEVVKPADTETPKGAAKGGFKVVKKRAKDVAIEIKNTFQPLDPKTWAEAEKTITIEPKAKE